MSVSQEDHLKELSKGYRFGWHDPSNYVFEPKRGLSEDVVEEISYLKSEPEWMRKFRLKALKHFQDAYKHQPQIERRFEGFFTANGQFQAIAAKAEPEFL